MLAAIPFPDIKPYLFQIDAFTLPLLDVEIGPLALRYYALAYIAGLVLGWLYVRRLFAMERVWPDHRPPATAAQTEDLLFYMTLGVVIGGRLGYVLFYEPGMLLNDPLSALALWQGGMAFHGGMLGVVVGVFLFARRVGGSALQIGDAVACVAPIGLLFGRIANFINAELWGRVTEQPWGVIFPSVQPTALGLMRHPDPEYQRFGAELLATVGQGRHPSQLYEAALEGALLLVVMAWLAFRTDALKRPGLCAGVFLIGYGAARALVEIWRQPDIVKNIYPLGVEITRGQLLSLPMILVGVLFVLYARRTASRAPARS